MIHKVKAIIVKEIPTMWFILICSLFKFVAKRVIVINKYTIGVSVLSFVRVLIGELYRTINPSGEMGLEGVFRSVFVKIRS